MAETSLSVKDAASATQALATQTISSKQYGGHWNKAVPEGGASIYRNINPGVTGAVVKASMGQLYGGMVFNLAGATPSGTLDRYLKIYNMATAPSSSDTPVLTIPLEAGVPTPIIIPDCGIAFATGISIRVTTGLADNDTGAPGSNEVIVNLFYA